jgi:hypothetical protein
MIVQADDEDDMARLAKTTDKGVIGDLTMGSDERENIDPSRSRAVQAADLPSSSTFPRYPT